MDTIGGVGQSNPVRKSTLDVSGDFSKGKFDSHTVAQCAPEAARKSVSEKSVGEIPVQGSGFDAGSRRLGKRPISALHQNGSEHKRKKYKSTVTTDRYVSLRSDFEKLRERSRKTTSELLALNQEKECTERQLKEALSALEQQKEMLITTEKELTKAKGKLSRWDHFHEKEKKRRKETDDKVLNAYSTELNESRKQVDCLKKEVKKLTSRESPWPQLKIAKSTIKEADEGLFATDKIPEGGVLGAYFGETVYRLPCVNGKYVAWRNAESDVEFIRNDDYVIWCDVEGEGECPNGPAETQIGIDGDSKGPYPNKTMLRKINHSANANTEAIWFEGKKLLCLATKEIAADEELFLNYGVKSDQDLLSGGGKYLVRSPESYIRVKEGRVEWLETTPQTKGLRRGAP